MVESSSMVERIEEGTKKWIENANEWRKTSPPVAEELGIYVGRLRQVKSEPTPCGEGDDACVNQVRMYQA